jgi:hypothetical protein
MGLLLELMDALLDGLTPPRAVSPPRRPRQAKGRRRGRWHRSGPFRYHWHLVPTRRRFYFVKKAGRWVCPFCGCA